MRMTLPPLRKIERRQDPKVKEMLKVLRKIVKYNPKAREICCDEWAYDRMVESYRIAIKKVITIGTNSK